MAILPQSTAYTRMFFMVDSSDHISKKTGLTCTVNISKAGGAFGAAGGTVTEVANGWYKIALTTTDTNTAGDLAYHVTATGADDTDFCDQVGPAPAQLADGVTHGGTSAVLTLEREIVASTTANEPAVKRTGNGTAPAVLETGGA